MSFTRPSSAKADTMPELSRAFIEVKYGLTGVGCVGRDGGHTASPDANLLRPGTGGAARVKSVHVFGAADRSVGGTCVRDGVGGSSDWQPSSWTACDDLLESQAREVIHADGCLFALHCVEHALSCPSGQRWI